MRVRDTRGCVGTVVEVSYGYVKVYFTGQGLLDFVRPRENSIAIPGASTVADLSPRDSTMTMSKMVTQILLNSEGFAMDQSHVVVVRPDSVKRYPIDKENKSRFEAILSALKLAVSDF